MPRIVIIGAGGHGREVAEIISHQNQVEGNIELLGFVDDNQDLFSRKIGGLPVLGDFRWFDGVDRSEISVICAVGNPKVCKLLVEKVESLHLDFANAISPNSLISNTAKIGRGVIVFPNVVISTNVTIADFCTVNVSATVSHDSNVEKYSILNPAANLAGNVKVGQGSFIGMGAKIIQGISIGSWAVIGAGSVVIKDVIAETTVVGVPARTTDNKNRNKK